MDAVGTQQHWTLTTVRILIKLNILPAQDTQLKIDKAKLPLRTKIVKASTLIFRLLKIIKIELNSSMSLISSHHFQTIARRKKSKATHNEAISIKVGKLCMFKLKDNFIKSHFYYKIFFPLHNCRSLRSELLA